MRPRRARSKTDTPLCKDFGGLSQKGLPCHRTSGWGTDHRGKGRCRDHDDPADALMQGMKEGFVFRLENGKDAMSIICQDLGIDQSTIYRWRQADPDFDNKITVAYLIRDDYRTAAVEDGFFLKLVQGKGGAGEYAYYLGNRCSERWRDVRQVQLGGIGGGPVEVEVQDARDRLFDKIVEQRERLAAAAAQANGHG